MQEKIKSKIKGALYGFAIGDAMGATTEFMDENEIAKKYGRVENIIGGGWLHLKAGEVTDDTQMTFCVCEAIQKAVYERMQKELLNNCCVNFVDWYLSDPKDIGACCRRVISACKGTNNHIDWMNKADDPDSLGNGSLMRTLPMVLSKQGEQTAILQGRLTHNNGTCDKVISQYYQNVVSLIDNDTFLRKTTFLVEPVGHVVNSFSNATYWAQHGSFKSAIIGAVNHGGDADTIAAITGSFAGALHGYEAIPKKWIGQLNKDVKKKLDIYANLFEKLY